MLCILLNIILVKISSYTIFGILLYTQNGGSLGFQNDMIVYEVQYHYIACMYTANYIVALCNNCYVNIIQSLFIYSGII